MVRIHCRTNLDDVMQCEKFPIMLDCRPMVGDYMESETE